MMCGIINKIINCSLVLLIYTNFINDPRTTLSIICCPLLIQVSTASGNLPVRAGPIDRKTGEAFSRGPVGGSVDLVGHILYSEHDVLPATWILLDWSLVAAKINRLCWSLRYTTKHAECSPPKDYLFFRGFRY